MVPIMNVSMSQEEFDSRVNENTETFKCQHLNNSFDISKYHLASHKKGELSIPILMVNIHDIYASIMVGSLASPNRHGCDAIIMNNNEQSVIELKTSYLSKTSTWKAPNGKVYTGTGNVDNKRRSISSHFKADYLLKMDNLEDKIIDTYLVCMDADNGNLICSYTLDRHCISQFLDYKKGSQNNGIYRKSITLNQFMNAGQIANTKIDQVGYIDWLESIAPDVPTLNRGEMLSGY